LKQLLRRFFTWLADKFTSKPNEKLIHHSLNKLYKGILERPEGQSNLLETRVGLVLPFEASTGRFIIFSDQHKGNGNAADDFVANRQNYAAALRYYLQQGYTYINLGDCEELWENQPEEVLKHYKAEMELEVAFCQQNRYYKVFGNHDLLWFDKPAVAHYLQPFFGADFKIYEGLVLQTVVNDKPVDIFLTHGHQGDVVSDSNAFSKWFVGRIWVPIQRWLKLNVNTPAKDYHLTDKHNRMMYLWTLQYPGMALITGHTHKPVFESLDHIQRLNKKITEAQLSGNIARENSLRYEISRRIIEEGGNPSEITTWLKPSYYNTGCCCFADGDITGIEIADGEIRLVKWPNKETPDVPYVAERASLQHVAEAL
jgi:predicted phosphodiesterase